MSPTKQLMAITLFSKILGLARELVFSYYLGTSSVKDVYVMATSVVILLTSFVNNSVTAAFIPSYNRIQKEEGEARARRFTSNISNQLALLAFFLVLLMVSLARPIMGLMARGWEGEKMDMTVQFTRIVVFSFIAISFHAPFNGYLNIYQDFISPSITVAINNIVLILFCFLAARLGDWTLLAVGYAFANFFQYIHFRWALKRTGYHHQLLVRKDEDVQQFALLSLPILLSVAATDVAQIIDKTIATTLFETGGASSLDYAVKIIAMVSGIVIASEATAVYPRLSELAQKRDREAYIKEVDHSIEVAYFLVIPIVAGLFVLAEPIIQFVLERGKFDHQSTLLTAGLLRYYSFSLLGETLYMLLTRVFYSFNDTKTPIRIMLVQVLFDIPFNFILSSLIGINGLAISYSIGMLAAGGYALICYKRRLKRVRLETILPSLGKMVLSALIMAAACYLLWNYLPFSSIYLRLPLTAILAALLYFVLTAAMGVEEAQKIFSGLKGRQS